MDIKRNILYLGGFELPDKNAAAHRVLNNSKLFSLLNFNTYFRGISKNIIHDETEFQKIVFGEEQFFSKAGKYPDSLLSWLRYVASITEIKKIFDVDLKKNLSIIIAYNYPSIKLWRLSLFCRRRNIKLVADITEWYDPEGQWLLKKIKSLDTWLRMNFIHFKMDGVITISNYLDKFYSNLLSVKLPPLVDKNSTKWRSKVKSIQNPKLILSYIGSPGTGKKDKLDLILKSLSEIKNKVPDFCFQIIGISKEEFKRKFLIYQIHPNINENVIFYGRVNHETALNLLRQSDFTFFLRSINRVNSAGFPTKFVESITSGIPVLTNLSSDLGEFLEDGKNGFILDIQSKEMLNQSLIHALNVPKDKLSFMKNYCMLDNSFHYEKYLDKTKRFFNALLAK